MSTNHAAAKNFIEMAMAGMLCCTVALLVVTPLLLAAPWLSGSVTMDGALRLAIVLWAPCTALTTVLVLWYVRLVCVDGVVPR